MFINSKILSVVGVLLVAVMSSQVRANMILNPEFNDGLDHYGYTASVTTVTDTHSYVAPNSALITFPIGYAGGYVDLGQDVSVVAGVGYDVSVAVDFQNMNSAHIKLLWLDAVGTAISTDYLMLGTHHDSGGWLVKSASLMAPVGAVTAALRVASWGSYYDTAPGYLWTDSVSIAPVPEPAALGLLGLGGLLLARRRSSPRPTQIHEIKIPISL